jgi:hypothetical protein
VMPAAVYRIHEQGNMVATENPFDLAIQGTGYFIIEQPSGEIAYTRDGSFQLSPQGLLVTADGYTVSPGITVPEDAVQVTVDATGQVQAKLANQIDPVDLGQLETAIFANEVGLEAIGNNLLMKSPASGPAATGIGDLAARLLDDEVAGALDREVEGILGRHHVALLVDPIDRGGHHAEPDLHAGRHDRAEVGAGGADAPVVLVQEVLELGAAALVASSGHVGDIVGDHLHVQLLGHHPGRGDAE